MKRIEFISPVDAMRGNLSGEQDLRYADGTKAYEGVDGEANAAKNYQPRFVGAKRASTGLKYFSVKTKATTNLTPNAKKAMARLGGMGSFIGVILANKTSALYAKLQSIYFKARPSLLIGGKPVTFRYWLSQFVYPALQVGSVITIPPVMAGETVLESGCTISNPWGNGGGDYDVEVSNAILAKFWNQLKANGISFLVDSMQGIAYTGETWATMIANSDENILGAVVSGDNVKIGDQYILTSAGAAVVKTDAIVANAKYILADTLPA